MKRFSSKHIALKVDCYRTGVYTVCRRVCASFSPEILQAGTVKGLSIADNGTNLNCFITMNGFLLLFV